MDGALRTGDIGYLDDEGYLFLVDRIKDVILCGGFNVYPRILEEALYQHPAVAEAVVVGVPDAYRGQIPKAFVTLRGGMAATPDELRAFLAGYVSRIELPREVEIRRACPGRSWASCRRRSWWPRSLRRRDRMPPERIGHAEARAEGANRLYTVTELAQELGVTARTIRFYEDKGLIAPQRAGITRVYTPRDRARMILILRGKRLGFTLRDIKDYLDLYDVDLTRRAQLRLLLRAVRIRISGLMEQRHALEQTLAELKDIEAQALAALAAKTAPRRKAAV